jgi:UDP-GlcNAc:undecaprenyl-phosphate/decaprenyl-phosphate GlcNAc-1-phosphate transferase
MGPDLSLLLISFFSCAIAAAGIILTNRFHGRFTNDSDFEAVQKFHSTPVPRIGGIALLLGLIIGGIYHGLDADQELYLAKWAGVAMIPVFLGGLLEDLGRGMTARDRLLLAFLSATIAHYELNIALERIDWEWFDVSVIPLPGVTLLLTVVMVGGVSHATNIIDGFNGLLLGVAVSTVTALLWVAYEIDASLLGTYFTIMLGALLGIFLFNFPFGRIFLGDSGAYLVGFFLSILSLTLLRNSSAVSPWFPLLLFAYPVTETIFSMFRKKVLAGSPAMAPDRYHYHMLMYEWLRQKSPLVSAKNANPLTSVAMWGVNLGGLIPAIVWWDDSSKLIIAFISFVVLYIASYFCLRSHVESI